MGKKEIISNPRDPSKKCFILDAIFLGNSVLRYLVRAGICQENLRRKKHVINVITITKYIFIYSFIQAIFKHMRIHAAQNLFIYN